MLSFLSRLVETGGTHADDIKNCTTGNIELAPASPRRSERLIEYGKVVKDKKNNPVDQAGQWMDKDRTN